MNAIYPDLKKKIILITGASRGIGRSIAQELARQGAHIAFNYRSNKEVAEELASELLALGATQASPLHFDITSQEQIDQALDPFLKEFPISGLVNNAGITLDQLLLKLKREEVEKVVQTNLLGAIFLTQKLSKTFLRQKDVSIVNMSSVIGLMGNSGQTIYSATKAGLIGFSKSLALELGRRNIRCNAICPGFISTEMTAELSEEQIKTYSDRIPLGRLGQAEDVASLCSFLLSRASSYITGEVIKIDGGLYT